MGGLSKTQALGMETLSDIFHGKKVNTDIFGKLIEK